MIRLLSKKVAIFILLGAFFAFKFPGISYAQLMTPEEIKRKYRKARRAYRQGRYEFASQEFFDIIENGGASPRYQILARYGLALTLFKQKLHLVSLDNVVQVLILSKKPDKVFRSSLRGLITISETVGDESLIIQMLRQIPLLKKLPPADRDPVDFLLNPTPRTKKKRWWKKMRNSFAYFMGRNYFLRGPKYFKLAHRFFSLLTPDAPHFYYLKALYMRGVMESWMGREKPAIKWFKKLLSYRYQKGKGKRKFPLILQKVREEAQYGIARSYYSLGRKYQAQYEMKPVPRLKIKYEKFYQKALKAYYKLPKRRGIFQGQMLFETAYTFMMMGQYHFALGQLLALQSPYYRLGFFPELEILRALIYFRTCKYGDTIQTINNFFKIYMPLKKKLRALLKKRKDRKWRAEYYAFYLKDLKALKEGKKTELPPALIAEIMKDKSLRNYEALIKKIDLERQQIRGKSSSWRESNIGRHLLRRAVSLRAILRKKAGDSVYIVLNAVKKQISHLITQGRFIKLETLKAQKEELLRYAEGGGLEQEEYPYTIVTTQRFIYWPFQGEFWRDEIGYYRQFIQGECKR